MTIDKLTTWALAAGASLIIGAGYMLDGPSADEVARMEAASMVDAKLAAQHFERDLRACKRALGPSADLIQIEGRDDYVCREMPIEPTPEHTLHRYVELAGRKI